MTHVDNTSASLSRQAQIYAEQIKVNQAAGSSMDKAVQDVRMTFERLLGPDADREADIDAAHRHIRAELERPIEYLGGYSVRKTPRPEWYGGPKGSDRYWPKLRGYLTEIKKWPADTVAKIDETSSEIVGLLSNPAQTEFRGRGLVVGYVQSGKTANMTAVMAKAADAGYRFIIVLAGLTNSLRLQTDARFHADLIDRDQHGWRWHTTPVINGDLALTAKPNFPVVDEVQLAVVKKNVTPLRKLRKMLQETPRNNLSRLPVLIIDDECDEASVNSSEYDITSINKLIRQILHQLPRVQYVGYTATPFANVLINPYADHGGMDDLYPEDFITSLPKPEGYFGAADLFGDDLLDADAEGGENSALDMIRTILPDEVPLLRPPSRAAQSTFQPELTPSLEAALRYFLLATACRRIRGQDDQHSSMLVHTTVYTAVHRTTAELVGLWRQETLVQLANRDAQLLQELEELWSAETARLPAGRFKRTPVDFADLKPILHEVLEEIEIIVENGRSDARLDYTSGPKKYIVVGGSVLARGLTIEGLMVSLFLRSSSQYDTLLQMGRWFGYRIGYEDLPRIWMPADLEGAFRDLARVELEIRDEIAQYVERKVNPKEVAVKIRQIPGMAVTAAGKMFHARRCDISFSNKHPQTIRFRHKDKDTVRENWNAASTLFSEAIGEGPLETVDGGRLVRGVSHETVRSFLRAYKAEPNFQKDEILDYLEKEVRRRDDPIRHWNVAVVEPARGDKAAVALGPLEDVRLSTRARMEELRDGAADIKALMSRGDILIDTELRRAGSWEELKRARGEAIGEPVPLLLVYPIDRASEPRKKGGDRRALDAVDHLIGIGIVLPDRGEAFSYVSVALEQEDASETEDLAAELEEIDAAEAVEG